MKKIRLLLVEDDCLIRKRIQSTNNTNNDITIIALRSELKNTLAEIKELKPGVVLIDMGLLSQSCFSVIEIVKRDMPSTKIIVAGLKIDQDEILKFVQARVNGFVLKNSSPKEIITTIKNVDGGSTVLPPLLINELFSQIVAHSQRKVNLNHTEKNNMTNRELEVMQFLGDGMSNKEIGSKMQISTFTVKSHIHNVMEKLSLHTRLEIANHSFNSYS
ncbi:MAG: response regulator transcription factor [Melioribacteraceae bacterium]|nr:response regulator transcription factor [Melioribacteraceae bacterium]MCF8396058.1 response regulator transcription factor [Melioribacteraceae bacterium]MCF8418956.1 response regulator transcription factor [Melioribacteraceae bacterium]